MTGQVVRALVVGFGLGALAVACGADVDATDYRAENRDAFLTACTKPGSDPRMIRDVCECTYEQIEANVAFSDFVALEESLEVDGLASLPDVIAGFVAECFVDEVDL
ncbi:MAG: hypothetical protein OEV40_15110 [Acidimicrobiia bacterium]|nr:hypothetical protein [Acidimicrobiia bacterium]